MTLICIRRLAFGASCIWWGLIVPAGSMLAECRAASSSISRLAGAYSEADVDQSAFEKQGNNETNGAKM
jgi:hypothetical protein